ncbi:putative uncharacterized protein [Parabacteroides merdae CAG:48]|nr:putative uncharacterized protein [Parabacteroides merdae CAG:48]
MKNNTRFSICLLFLWMSMNFCLAAETYSQETFFTIESNNLTVKEVFNKIEKESEYIFFYLDNSVDLNRKVSVKAYALFLIIIQWNTYFLNTNSSLYL